MPASFTSESNGQSWSDFRDTGKQSKTLLRGAVIQGGNFSIHINTVAKRLPSRCHHVQHKRYIEQK